MTVDQTYQALVVGAGPGGLATVASLLDGGIESIYWVDPTFGGGRLNSLYREISSCATSPQFLNRADLDQ